MIAEIDWLGLFLTTGAGALLTAAMAYLIAIAQRPTPHATVVEAARHSDDDVPALR